MANNQEIHLIPLTEIKVDKYNVRRHERNADIDQLAESIKNHGQMQPIVLMGVHGKPPYQLIVGQRRFLAHQHLNRQNIKAVFIDKLSEIDALLYSLAENLQRTELNFADKSESITKLYHLLNKSVKEVAKKLGISQPTVLEYVKINDFLDAETKTLVTKSKINKSELKRAIKLAKGDSGTLKKHLTKFKELSPFEQKRAVSRLVEEPKATFNEALEYGKKAKIEEQVVVRLSRELNDALVRASKETNLDKDEVAKQAIEEWLHNNGFLNQ